MALLPFELTVGANLADRRVVLDGQDVSKFVRRISLDMHAGPEVPVLYIEAYSDGSVAGEALVMMLGASVIERLGQLDPGAIEQRALEILSDGFDGSTGAGFIRAITEALLGDD